MRGRGGGSLREIRVSAGYNKDERREFTVSLPSPDGTFEAVARIEVNKDPTKAPRLINVDKYALDPPGPDRTAEQRETHIILSLGSGHVQAASFFQDVVSPILTVLYGPEGMRKMRIDRTRSATSILDFTNERIFPEANGTSNIDLTVDQFGLKEHAAKPLRIILLSGDGGIVDLVNGLSSKPTRDVYVAPQVVLLPLGTANALYHSINVGKPNTWGLSALSSPTSTPLPIFTATFSPGARLLVDEARKEEQLSKDAQGNGVLHGAVVCSWAMHASLVADSDTTAFRKYGVERFKMAAKEALYPSDNSPPHAYKGCISVLKDDEWRLIEEDVHTYVLATLVSHLEQPFCISPASKPLDGSMHLVHFGPRGGDEVMRIMGLAYQGGLHVEEGDIRYEDIDGLRIEFRGKEEEGRWRRICVDGKIVRVETDGWVEVRKERRRVVDIIVDA
ncbi:hypothetical protein EJ02DRAFT_448742 [Clathrospora elynae]|uniref:DAGKc domain-containing protein n=1 Tax=Clathrospora elynae TaxID=706981 RepID=A0A6A5S669_9PLEO|nr:hypothetical protein EJ02DRAFT_448742 [Clathrospora elynae]